MFDWMFAAMINNVISSLKITFWIIRGIAHGVAALLNISQQRK